jgi:hypothetical protein
LPWTRPEADGIGLELLGLGFEIIDSARTATIARNTTEEIEYLAPESLAALSNNGADAILSCRAVIGYDGSPDNASVRLISTRTGTLIGGATWTNGSDGQRGSLADRDQRQDNDFAAKNLAEVLSAQLKRKAAIEEKH